MIHPFNPSGLDCSELLTCLEDEQVALENLLFKLKQQNDILASGEHRWLPQATAEVSAALSTLGLVSGTRERAASAVHIALGLSRTANLGDVADAVADELTCQLIHQHKRALRDLLDQVRRVSRRNRDLLAHGLAATTDALSLLGTVPTYDSAGAVNTSSRPRLLDVRS